MAASRVQPPKRGHLKKTHHTPTDLKDASHLYRLRQITPVERVSHLCKMLEVMLLFPEISRLRADL